MLLGTSTVTLPVDITTAVTDMVAAVGPGMLTIVGLAFGFMGLKLIWNFARSNVRA